MTASISIATRKPSSKRAAKVLILTGADGKYARRDGRCEEHVSVHTSKPDLDAGTAIFDSIEGDLSYGSDLPDWPRGRKSRRSVHTSESANFVCSRPTKRRRVRSVARQAKPVIPTSTEPPQYDEAGRPIVYKTDDAWSYRIFR